MTYLDTLRAGLVAYAAIAPRDVQRAVALIGYCLPPGGLTEAHRSVCRSAYALWDMTNNQAAVNSLPWEWRHAYLTERRVAPEVITQVVKELCEIEVGLR